jgi:thymidylate synthase (FAD)
MTNTAKIIAMTESMIIDPNTNNRLTPQEFLAYTARVSNPGNQMNNATSEKLLQYCMKNQHWSVFEQVNVVMVVETTRDIGRQLLRHRSYSFQEFSQRYADPTKDLGFVTREARLQDNKNRQNSIETDDENLMKEWEDRQQAIIRTANETYRWAIENGVAKEQARAILPEGLTLSRLYVSGSVRSWITYIMVRAKHGTQKEHMEIAECAYNELLPYFPFMAVLRDSNNN